MHTVVYPLGEMGRGDGVKPDSTREHRRGLEPGGGGTTGSNPSLKLKYCGKLGAIFEIISEFFQATTGRSALIIKKDQR